jgi:hypothetical protein
MDTTREPRKSLADRGIRHVAPYPTAKLARMKMLLQILVAVILHPLALVLMIINLLGRDDLDGGKKLIWGLVGILWGIGPILYITLGEGALW